MTEVLCSSVVTQQGGQGIISDDLWTKRMVLTTGLSQRKGLLGEQYSIVVFGVDGVLNEMNIFFFLMGRKYADLYIDLFILTQTH